MNKFLEWFETSGHEEMESSGRIYEGEPRDVMLSAWQASRQSTIDEVVGIMDAIIEDIPSEAIFETDARYVWPERWNQLAERIEKLKDKP